MEKGRFLDNMRRQCSAREYCISDIRRKAAKAQLDEAAAEEVVEKLLADKYVDESRYARAFAADKSALAGWGPVKIRYALGAKGIPAECIAEALEGIDADRSVAKLEKMLSVRAASAGEGPAARAKLLRWALGRGYSYDRVNGVLDKII